MNAAQLESQLATDSSNLISAETSAQQLLLQLKALLNLDAAADFDIASVPVDMVPVENLADLQPEAVYNLALANLPQQKVDELNLKAALKSVQVARGSMYPTFSLFGSLGTTYNNKANEIKSSNTVECSGRNCYCWRHSLPGLSIIALLMFTIMERYPISIN